VLGMLLARRDADPWVRDEDGAPRAWLPVRSWEDLVALALDELRIAGHGNLQLHRRMLALLEDLLDAAPPARREPLRVRREALLAAAGDAFREDLDVRAAQVASATGQS
jgi:uncharacterized membrane protein